MKKIVIVSSFIGEIRIGWSDHSSKIDRIFLPNDSIEFYNGSVEIIKPYARRKIPNFVDELIGNLENYFDGNLVRFSWATLDGVRFTEFQQNVYEYVHSIPFGETVTYAQVAARVGRKKAARAVGAAMAANPFPIVVPCHRVIASDGRLRGYRGGLTIKEQLLRMEGVQCDLGILPN